MGLAGAFHAFWFDRSERISDYGSPAGYRCTECDNEVRVDGDQALPACLICKRYSWEPLEAAPEPVVLRRVVERLENRR